jgi:mannosyl-oligosaccharide alpha-1,2-mannosidase
MIIAAVALLLLYRMTQGTDWDSLATPIDYTKSQKSNAAADQQTKAKPLDLDLDIQRKRPQEPQKPLKNSDADQAPVKIPDLKEPQQGGKHVDYTLPTTTTDKKPEPTAIDAEKPPPKKNTDGVPEVVIPDRKTPHQQWEEDAKKEKEEAEALRNPALQTTKTKTHSTTSTSTIHWERPTEHFPVSSDSIIPLPTGKPKSVSTVQYAFKEETAATRQKREERLAQVKVEMIRAWTGYKTYAWMHDELSPVSHKFRDPFCGWAATLVDALDTLWIMGMKDEFEEAVQAVGDIDFTVATRSEIPVFETTIRYLGGLLGAYDVSGGHEGGHKILLDKAVELGEILMGVFDTPNRMPVLYYGWTPASMKRPRRAATSANVAELGSLAMEFTRLAQLTNENKYYDAVARITDALEEWQNKPHGTNFPGIFPDMVDASGCNATALGEARSKFFEKQTAKAQLEQAQTQAQAQSQTILDTPDDYTGREYDQAGKTNPSKKLDAESELAGSAGMAKPNVLNRRSIADDAVITGISDSTLTPQKPVEEFTAPLINSAPDLYQQMRENQVTGEPYTIKELGNDVCYPQGLTAGGWGRESYGMGGGQDSTYEYFPKMYLLLGGLEPKYQDMHLKVAAAVKKWLLYRPMVPNNDDILFSAKLSTSSNPEKDLISDFEVTHLTCFLGGMFGMAGKIFEEAVDVEVGKKLADGCVWAYGATPSGIMPEGAQVVPCAETANCEWNETLWHQYLDPLWNTREDQIEDWYKRKAEYERMQAEAEAEGARWDEEQRLKAQQKEQAGNLAGETVSSTAEVVGLPSNSEKSTTVSPGLRKRDVRGSSSSSSERLETSSDDNSPPTRTSQKSSKTVKTTGADSSPVSKFGKNGRKAKAQTPIFNDQFTTEEHRGPIRFDVTKPLTHEEFVESRLKNEHIPRGFTNINSRSYIMR